MFKVVVAAFICFKLKLCEIHRETSVSIKLRSRLCRSIAFVQSALAMHTYGAPFFFSSKR